MLDFEQNDSDRLYLQAFEDEEHGFATLEKALAATKSWSEDLAERVYQLYLTHVRHVLASRRDSEYLEGLSTHLQRARELTKRPNLNLSRRLGVLEDMVEDAVAKVLPATEVKRRREHVLSILKSLNDADDGLIERAKLRDSHNLGDANMSCILKVMEEDRLVERQQQGRQVWVLLSAEGREYLRQAGALSEPRPV